MSASSNIKRRSCSTKKAVPEGMTCVCGQFQQKGSLDWHKRKVHEVMNYPCAQCHHQEHQKEIMHNKTSCS